jgi:cold shock CspA family protein
LNAGANLLEVDMQVPLHIELQGMGERPDIRQVIQTRVAELEQRFGRITACQVFVRAPGEHHETGGPYHVTIRLTLPNASEVNVGRTVPLDERHGDLSFAIHDAFKRARRRLQDYARRIQGQVKQHEHQPTGTVIRLDGGGEFGFLQANDGHEVYFHRNSVPHDGFRRLRVGSRVAFSEEMGEKGPQASTMRLLGKHGLRP